MNRRLNQVFDSFCIGAGIAAGFVAISAIVELLKRLAA